MSATPAPGKPAATADNADIVTACLGNWGQWQRRAVLLIYLCKIPSAWFMASIIFTAPTPWPGEFYCAQVAAGNESAAAAVDGPDDFCWRTDDVNASAAVCEVFGHRSPVETVVTQFDLVCGRSILLAVSQFAHLFGVLTGGLLANVLLKYQSPRNLMLFGMVTQICSGCIIGLTDDLIVHIVFRFVAAVCCAQMYTAGQMIFVDITGGRPRSLCLCLFETFWSLGVILLPLVAVLQPAWTGQYLLIALPTCLYAMLWVLIPESPRWLLRHDRADEAKLVLVAGAVYNGRTAAELPADLDERLHLTAVSSGKEVETPSWWSLWRRTDPKTRVLWVVAAHVAWPVYVTNYNGMLVNVKAYGREFLSLNTALLGFCELLGVLIGLTLILRTERKWLWAGLVNVVAGLVTFGSFALPETLSARETTAALMVLAALAKVAVSTAQSMLFTCTGELVAPEKRPMLLMSCVVWARIWLLGAPFVVALNELHGRLALVVFGGLSMLGGLAMTVLPRRPVY